MAKIRSKMAEIQPGVTNFGKNTLIRGVKLQHKGQALAQGTYKKFLIRCCNKIADLVYNSVITDRVTLLNSMDVSRSMYEFN